MLSRHEDIPKYSLRPAFLRSLYDTAEYVPATTAKNVLGVACYLRDYPNTTDLAKFLNRYRSDAIDATYKVVLVNGGEYDQSKPTNEGSLDIQYTEAMAYPTPITFYSTGEGTPAGTVDRMTAWVKFVIDEPKPPQTITTSYGQDESFGSKEYSVYLCDLFMQLGARGVSLLFATGDGGVGKGNCVRFNPFFPATCMCTVFLRLGVVRKCGSRTLTTFRIAMLS